MNSWVSRLLGRSDKKAGKPIAAPREAADAQPVQRAQNSDWQPDIDLDTVFLRWLLGADGGASASSSSVDKNILDALARLAGSSLTGADLIPRVPAVIPQLLQSMHNENISGAELAQGIARDVSLVAEVIRQANSSYYQPRQPITSIENAVMVLGKNGLRLLIAKAAFRPVIHVQSGRYAKSAAPLLWEQSEKCSQACRILAQQERLDPFAAFLAGLMQNVGMIVAFRLIDQVPDSARLAGPEEFCRAFARQARTLSHQVAAHWNLPENVVAALGELREAGMPASATARIVLQSDRLSKLRMLADQGVLPMDENVAAGMPPNTRQCFEEIKSGKKD